VTAYGKSQDVNLEIDLDEGVHFLENRGDSSRMLPHCEQGSA
jgi:hypothetical protein